MATKHGRFGIVQSAQLEGPGPFVLRSANVRARAARQQFRIRPNPWLIGVLLGALALLIITLV
jgi:hypothetical protein